MIQLVATSLLVLLGQSGPACADVANPLAVRARLERERSAWTHREAELVADYEGRIAELLAELEQLQDERLEREREWLSYTRAIGALAPRRETPTFSVRLPEVEDEDLLELIGPPREADAPEPDPDAPPTRARQIFLALRSLLIAEQIDGLDLLESGVPRDGATGPVVFRTLDARGRPMGSISAERLRLEGSRAAQTMTLVLEDGYERRAGERLAFSSDPERMQVEGSTVRRFVFPHVDPAPWIEALPELFSARSAQPVANDGRWDLGLVRRELNELLALDSAYGYYRLRKLGGVHDEVLYEVQLEHLDREGRLERRLFADRMTMTSRERGVLLELTGGAQVRGESKAPFLDDRYRIFLPRADLDRWYAAGLPGLSRP